MSNTGATDETPWDYVYSALFGNFAMGDETAQVYADAVIEAFDGVSAFRIVPATAVPTADELAAMRWIDANPFSRSDLTRVHRRLLEAYLERQR